MCPPTGDNYAAKFIRRQRFSVQPTIDPARTAFSQFPSSVWEVKHSCLTAYHVAGHAAGEGRNVFDPALYNAPDDDPTRVRVRWDDGHTSILTPSAGVASIESGKPQGSA